MKLRVSIARLIDRLACPKESVMSEPEEPTAYMAAPPPVDHPQDEEED